MAKWTSGADSGHLLTMFWRAKADESLETPLTTTLLRQLTVVQWSRRRPMRYRLASAQWDSTNVIKHNICFVTIVTNNAKCNKFTVAKTPGTQCTLISDYWLLFTVRWTFRIVLAPGSEPAPPIAVVGVNQLYQRVAARSASSHKLGTQL